ncbi:N-6 DNA methylase [Alteromonas macleodii]|uniref:N-6 DNA methylase n=1 Tax=Alteromonas macleodii TaxID=28108 RepID=UPI000AB69215|nr:N-6 DNA methylase [Alteromonas macleodii]CAI3929076.1 N-6 DNA Methylase [Alteromonas macleodii]VTP50350.1 N-6 DNA Methylase [Alteromonas macleodii]
MIDQYFTPRNLASELVKITGFENVNCVVDPTCGSGNLLEAIASQFSNAQCIGIDSDKSVIRNLQKIRPNWILSNADLMDTVSLNKTSALFVAKKCDLLLLNPPYSQNNRKYLPFRYQGDNVRCSVAMSFLLQALTTFSPRKGALLIVPESMMYSELDEHARYLISQDYDIELLTELRDTTFEGARVRALAIKLTKISKEQITAQKVLSSPEARFDINIIRGGAQMHRVAKDTDKGTKVIHTVDLLRVYKNKTSYSGRISKPLSGKIKGKTLLISRVGIPHVKDLKVVEFHKEVQLSDCVIAIMSEKDIHLRKAESLIKNNQAEFVGLYRGTGARYVTKSRLEQWFIEKGAFIKS